MSHDHHMTAPSVTAVKGMGLTSQWAEVKGIDRKHGQGVAGGGTNPRRMILTANHLRVNP